MEIEEKHGPRVGVTLNLEGANLILQRHLGLPCKMIKEIKRGFNNRVYIVTADKPSEPLSFIIRLSGIHWTKLKTEAEVAAIIYLKKKCTELPVPKIYGYCSDRQLSGIGHEYIVMEHMRGIPLDDVFSGMVADEQKIVMSQITDILVQIKSAEIFNQIGSFGFVSNISDTHGLDRDIFNCIQLDHIVIGKLVDQCVGPFDTYLEYFKTVCEMEILELKKCKFMEPQLRNLQRIQDFVEFMADPYRTPLSETVCRPHFVFTHGDFEPRNILVDGTTVSGVLDFEFSGSYPIDNEWYDGFNDFGATTSSWSVFDGELADEPDPTNLNSIRTHFLSECKQKGIPIPQDIPGHFDRAELYHFWINICPWYLREVREDIPENWYKERDLSLRRVDAVLSKYGF